MNSHDYDAAYNESNLRPRRLEQPYHQREPRPYVAPDVLDRSTLAIEKKTFHIIRARNAQGQYLRIEEEHANFSKRNAIVIPMDGLPQFIDLLQSVAGLPVAPKE